MFNFEPFIFCLHFMVNLNKRFRSAYNKSGGVKTERVFPGLSVLRKNKKMEVLYPEK
jgi:hypothetical protein